MTSAWCAVAWVEHIQFTPPPLAAVDLWGQRRARCRRDPDPSVHEKLELEKLIGCTLNPKRICRWEQQLKEWKLRTRHQSPDLLQGCDRVHTTLRPRQP